MMQNKMEKLKIKRLKDQANANFMSNDKLECQKKAIYQYSEVSQLIMSKLKYITDPNERRKPRVSAANFLKKSAKMCLKLVSRSNRPVDINGQPEDNYKDDRFLGKRSKSMGPKIHIEISDEEKAELFEFGVKACANSLKILVAYETYVILCRLHREMENYEQALRVWSTAKKLNPWHDNLAEFNKIKKHQCGETIFDEDNSSTPYHDRRGFHVNNYNRINIPSGPDELEMAKRRSREMLERREKEDFERAIAMSLGKPYPGPGGGGGGGGGSEGPGERKLTEDEELALAIQMSMEANTNPLNEDDEIQKAIQLSLKSTTTNPPLYQPVNTVRGMYKMDKIPKVATAFLPKENDEEDDEDEDDEDDGIM